MKTDVAEVVDIARSAQKDFGEGGLCAAIGKMRSIQNLVAGGPLSEIYCTIDMLIRDLEMYKGQDAVEDIETFIEIICSRYDHEERKA